MTIPTVTPYTGEVANPDGSQTQAEFTQNMFDQLSFEKTFVPELNNSIAEINNTASQVDIDATIAAQSASDAQIAANSVATVQFVRSRIGNISDYVGDTLTESERFNIYQYPDDSDYWYGVKDGETFPITIPSDPSSDDKWAVVNGLTADSISGLTNYQAASVADMIAGHTIGGWVIEHVAGQVWSVLGVDYRCEAVSPSSLSDFTKITPEPAQYAVPNYDDHPTIQNPIITKADVVDRPTCQGVADPFIVQDEKGTLHCFYEVITPTEEEIGHSFSDNGGATWQYTGVVLSEVGQHFAYPSVFNINGEWYMIPDKGNTVDIYKASSFPTGWQNIKTIHTASTDATVFLFKDRWYMHVQENGVVNLYSSPDLLTGNFVLHPSSPIISEGGGFDRGAGNAIVDGNAVYLPIQGYGTSYGEWADWYVLTNLSETTGVATKAKRALRRFTGSSWKNRGSHHISTVNRGISDIAVVDGIQGASSNDWSIGLYAKTNRDRPEISGVFAGAAQSITTTDAWVKLSQVGSTNGRIKFDSNYIWSSSNQQFTINEAGIYDLSLSAGFYASTDFRNVKIRIQDVTNNVTLAEASETTAAGGSQLKVNTLSAINTLPLASGINLELQAQSDVPISVSPESWITSATVRRVGN